ncbi:hypothetical protein OGATHE_006497 [Ogataea polymorpha]|uniref:Uncharacterized protein n=1 Tax=Ogataea polymorpha TaxID=460523 RepID=A0A9P8SXJ4_9ASCO|nr:hypothetical protein OGATHE_006497 [Ogataea polymorpha]
MIFSSSAFSSSECSVSLNAFQVPVKVVCNSASIFADLLQNSLLEVFPNLVTQRGWSWFSINTVDHASFSSPVSSSKMKFDWLMMASLKSVNVKPLYLNLSLLSDPTSTVSNRNIMFISFSFAETYLRASALEQ